MGVVPTHDYVAMNPEHAWIERQHADKGHRQVRFTNETFPCLTLQTTEFLWVSLESTSGFC